MAHLMLILLFSSCASIFSKSSYPIIINSNPIRADITISNSSGHVIYAGITPATIRLDAGEKFFKKASYSVKFVKDGYDEKIMPINFKLDGWYWGNILLVV